MTDITGFYEGETKKFSVTCQIGGVAQDIRTDQVTLYLKADQNDEDDDAVLVKNADVATSGETGIALFTLSKADTEIPVGTYFIEVLWTRANGETYVAYPNDLPYQVIEVKNKLSDLP